MIDVAAVLLACVLLARALAPDSDVQKVILMRDAIAKAAASDSNGTTARTRARRRGEHAYAGLLPL